jgi:hypothetical protein
LTAWTSPPLAALFDERPAGAGLDGIEDETLRSTSARIALAAVTGAKLENVVNGIELPQFVEKSLKWLRYHAPP